MSTDSPMFSVIVLRVQKGTLERVFYQFSIAILYILPLYLFLKSGASRFMQVASQRYKLYEVL